MRKSNRLAESAITFAVVALTATVAALLNHFMVTLAAMALILIACAISAVATSIMLTEAVSRRLPIPELLRALHDSEAARAKLLHESRVVSNVQLQAFERDVDVRQIWVVTREPEFDASPGGNSFWGVVKHNLDRGIIYTYIVPDSLGTSSLRALTHSVNTPSLRVILVPDAQWVQLPYSDGATILYNPESEADSEPCVAYMELPEREELSWARIGTRLAVTWADRIERLAFPGGRDGH